MRMAGRMLGSVCVAALGFAAAPNSADAAVLNLSCSLITPDPNVEAQSCPGSAPSYLIPGQYQYNRQFDSPEASGAISGSDVYGGSVYGSLGTAGFVDDYFFQITPAQADVVSATISLGNQFSIDNLFARIYSLDSNPGGLLASGIPNGTVYYGTINSSGPVSTVQIDPVALSAGSYVLEITGVSNGTLGGSYFGNLNLGQVAVPLPAGLVLMLSGMGALAGFVRRRRLLPAAFA